MSNITDKCQLYYNPETGCKSNLFEEEELNTLITIYPIIGCFFHSIFIIVLILEIRTDLLRINNLKHNVLIYVKGAGILYNIIALIGIFIFIYCAVNKTANLAPILLIVTYVASAILIDLYLLAIFQWLLLILKAKNLGRDPHKILLVVVIILMVVVTVVVGVIRQAASNHQRRK